MGLRSRVLAASSALALLVGGIFVVLIVAISELRDSSDAARHSEQVLAAANRLERRVIDLETGLRGLLLTRDERFLRPFRSAQAAVPPEARRLERLVTTNPAQEASAKAIFAGIDAYLKKYVVPQVLSGKPQPGDRTAARITDDGRRRVEHLRQQFSQFIAAESALADTRRSSADQQARTAVLIGVLGLVVSVLLVLAFSAYLSGSLLRPIGRVAAGARRLAGGDLSARVDEQHGGAEVGELARTFNVMAGSLEENRDELESQNAELAAQQAELESAVAQLAEEKRQVEVLHRFGARLQEHAELEPLAAAALDEMCDISGCEVGALYARGRDERTREGATLLATHGIRTDTLPPRLDPGEGPAGRAMAERHTVHGGQGESQLTAAADIGAVVRAELHVPLIQSERHVGVVSLGRVPDEPFSDDDVAAVQHLAGQAALALSNARALQVARHQARINRAVLETANEAFLALNEQAQVTAWNPAAERLFDWRGEDAVGQPVAELIVPERDRANLRTELERFLSTGESRLIGRQIEVTATRRDGQELPVEVTISPLNLDGRWVFNVFLRDITARRRSQLHLETQNAVVRVLAEASTAEDALPRLLAALGETLNWQLGTYWSVDEHAGHLWLDTGWSAPEVDRERWEAVSRELPYEPGVGVPGRAWQTADVQWVEDLPHDADVRRSQTARELGLSSMVSVPIRSGTTTIGVIDLLSVPRRARDDELVALMVYLGQQIGQYLDRKASEREAEILKDQFFALVSHELRTPLTSIIGYLELVLEDSETLAPNQRRFLSVVDRNARRLLRLVGDLLFVAHVEAGRLALEMGEVDLRTLTTEAVEAARPRAEGKDLALEAVVDGVPPMAGDRDRLAQVLDNLVSNAVKFTPERGSVTVRLTAQDSQALIEVEDSGVGIPAAEQERLFERFFRASTATERAIPGVGLGLTIAKAIVEAHGGALDFESVVGTGTTFRVHLPLRRPPDGVHGGDRVRGGVPL
jgi:PAS domain S-box-containing protein